MSRQIATKKRRLYNHDNLCAAVQRVRDGSMSVRQAAGAYSVPKSTISDKVSGKTLLSKCSPGPVTVLSTEEENRLADWAINMSRVGYGRTKQELLDTVQKILNADGRDNPFTDNRPGKDWYIAFMKRHPILSQRQQQQLGKERAVVSPDKVESWFADLKKYLDTEVHDDTLWTDPTRWYNADESGFPLNPKGGKVLAMKGCSNVYQVTSSDKSQITVLACMSASGHYVTPMIVYAGQRFSYNPLDGFDEAVMGRSENGWMDTELFKTWLSDVFVKDINQQNLKKPVILIVDGHSTHITLEASEICQKNGIILYCLLPHASHIMQPCDLRLFGPLKEHWRQAVRNFTYENIGETVTKQSFAKVFKGAWMKSATVGNGVTGFRDAGLFPFSPAKVMGTVKMEPSKVFTPTVPVSENVTPDIGAAATSTNVSPGVSVTPVSTPERYVVSNTLDAAVSSLVTPVMEVPSSSPSLPQQAGQSDVPSPISSPSIQSSVPNISNNAHVQPRADSSSTAAPVSATAEAISPPTTTEPSTFAFDNILKLPRVTVVKRKSNTNRIILPKAVTSAKFREIMEQKQFQKQKLEEEKQRKKLDREQKRNEREEDKVKKLKLKNAKLRLKEMKNEKKSSTKLRQLLDDDSDDAQVVSSTACYSCENQFESSAADWIDCKKCQRRFHIACVPMLDIQLDDYFECKYC